MRCTHARALPSGVPRRRPTRRAIVCSGKVGAVALATREITCTWRPRSRTESSSSERRRRRGSTRRRRRRSSARSSAPPRGRRRALRCRARGERRSGDKTSASPTHDGFAAVAALEGTPRRAQSSPMSPTGSSTSTSTLRPRRLSVRGTRIGRRPRDREPGACRNGSWADEGRGARLLEPSSFTSSMFCPSGFVHPPSRSKTASERSRTIAASAAAFSRVTDAVGDPPEGRVRQRGLSCELDPKEPPSPATLLPPRPFFLGASLSPFAAVL